MRSTAYQLLGLAMVSAVGLAVWPLAGAQYAIGLVTGILVGGGLGMRLARPTKANKEGGQS